MDFGWQTTLKILLNINFLQIPWAFVAIQQWTNKQQVPGINSKVDGDVFFGDVATFKKYGYKTPTPTDPCADVKQQLVEANKTIDSLRNSNNELRTKINTC